MTVPTPEALDALAATLTPAQRLAMRRVGLGWPDSGINWFVGESLRRRGLLCRTSRRVSEDVFIGGDYEHRRRYSPPKWRHEWSPFNPLGHRLAQHLARGPREAER
jgi:hypothetical protein